MTPKKHWVSARSLTAQAILLATVPALLSQTSRPLEWRLEQQPTTVPCTPEDIAFVNAPEQVFLEKSYNLVPQFPAWTCESMKAPAFNEARVLIISRPSMIDDGEAYSLIRPHSSNNARLIPFSNGGRLLWGNEDDWHNRAAMNAILQNTKYGKPETIDWLSLSLAYLTILGENPDLANKQYSPGPGEHFKSYSVPGLLSELPDLARKHQLPTLTCTQWLCTVHFYYRMEPTEPLKVADLNFYLENGTVSLVQAKIHDDAAGRRSKKSSN